MIPVTNKVIIPLKEVKGKTLYQMIVCLVEKGLTKVNETGFGYDPETMIVVTAIKEGTPTEIDNPDLDTKLSKTFGIFHTHPKSVKDGVDCECFSFGDILGLVALHRSWCVVEKSVFNIVTRKLFIITFKKLEENDMVDKINDPKYQNEIMDFIRRHSVEKTYDEIQSLASQ